MATLRGPERDPRIQGDASSSARAESHRRLAYFAGRCRCTGGHSTLRTGEVPNRSLPTSGQGMTLLRSPDDQESWLRTNASHSESPTRSLSRDQRTRPRRRPSHPAPMPSQDRSAPRTSAKRPPLRTDAGTYGPTTTSRKAAPLQGIAADIPASDRPRSNRQQLPRCLPLRPCRNCRHQSRTTHHHLDRVQQPPAGSSAGHDRYLPPR